MQHGKQIVTPQWLSDSVTKKTVLPFEQYYALKARTHGQGDGSSIESIRQSLEKERAQTPSEGSQFEGPSTTSIADVDPVASRSLTPTAFNPQSQPQTSPLSNSRKPASFGVRTKSDNSRFACQRLSPLVCPNQALLQEIGVIKWSRHLEGNSRSALSYSRAISVSLPIAGKSSSRLFCGGLERHAYGPAGTFSLPQFEPSLFQLPLFLMIVGLTFLFFARHGAAIGSKRHVCLVSPPTSLKRP